MKKNLLPQAPSWLLHLQTDCTIMRLQGYDLKLCSKMAIVVPFCSVCLSKHGRTNTHTSHILAWHVKTTLLLLTLLLCAGHPTPDTTEGYCCYCWQGWLCRE